VPPPPAPVEGEAANPNGNSTQAAGVTFDRVPASGPFGFTTAGFTAPTLGLSLPVDLAAIAPAAGGGAEGCAVSAEAWANAMLQGFYLGAPPAGCPAASDPGSQ
jgi:hypothetical protein